MLKYRLFQRQSAAVSAVLATTWLGLAACTSVPAPSGEYLDEQSGSTIAVATEPMVFARERSDVAASARDYATLVAVESNNAGKFAEYLLLYRWSTVDRRMSPLPPQDAGELSIEAEGRVIDLKPIDPFPFELSGRPALHVPATADFVAHAYLVDLPLLRFMAASRVLSVRLPQEPLASPYALWRDGRAALGRLVRRASGS